MFNRIREKLGSFMYGRYGTDHLYYAIFALWAVIAIINTFLDSIVLYVINSAILVILIWRPLSKNIQKRRRENDVFLNIVRKIKEFLVMQKDRLRDIRTARYRYCKHCGAMLKLPIRTGRHTVRCPKCGERFDVRIFF